MNTKLLVILFCSVLVSFVLYKLYINDNKNSKNSNYNNIIEHFGIIEKMKNISKNKTKNQKKQKFSNTNSKKKATFDDLFKATEHMDPERYSLNNMFSGLSEYKESFNKAKFKNNSKNTAEAFEKFALYKEQFFNIFK